MADTPILTVDEYKISQDILLTDTTKDAKIEQMIRMVGAAINRLTDRDFGAELVTTTRLFEYKGGGILDIDDCTTITSVKVDGRTLGSSEYVAQPQNEDVFFWLDVYLPIARGISPEMGFTYNLDKLYNNLAPRPVFVEVQATFGWTTVPEDVKLAAIEMIREVFDNPNADLQSQSLSEYSYSLQSNNFSSGRWPRRAIELLQPYRRIKL